MSEREIADVILETIDTAIGMVLDSNGTFLKNTVTIPMNMPEGAYELVITFKKKGIEQ